MAAGCEPVVVVLGAHGEAVAAELTGLPVRTVDNPEWQLGMGRSLRVGVRALPEVEAVLVLAGVFGVFTWARAGGASLAEAQTAAQDAGAGLWGSC